MVCLKEIGGGRVLLIGLWVKKEEVGKRSLVIWVVFLNNVVIGVVKNNKFKINLDEYMVIFEKFIGI